MQSPTCCVAHGGRSVMMKKQTKIAKNYAQALFELTSGEKYEEVQTALTALSEAIKQTKNISLMFESPLVSKEEKKGLVKKIFKQDKMITNFLNLLIDKQRTNLLPEIQNEFNKLVDKSRGIVHAEVSSAFRLDSITCQSIKEKLEKILLSPNEKVKIMEIVEPELIGGVKVKVKDRVYDGSIKGAIENLKRRLG